MITLPMTTASGDVCHRTVKMKQTQNLKRNLRIFLNAKFFFVVFVERTMLDRGKERETEREKYFKTNKTERRKKKQILWSEKKKR